MNIKKTYFQSVTSRNRFEMHFLKGTQSSETEFNGFSMQKFLKSVISSSAAFFLFLIFISLSAVIAQEPAEKNSGESNVETDGQNPDEKRGKLHIEWTAVEGVQGYFVQLKSKKTDKVIFEKRVDGTSVDIEVPAGEYMQRVGVINKFHKVSSFTEWSDFTIVHRVTPVIREIQNGDIKIDEGEKLVTIFGEKFQKNALVKLLSSENGKTIEIKPEYMSETMIQMKVSPDSVPEGTYHVMVENPGGQKAKKENSVALYAKKPPRAFREEASLASNDSKRKDKSGFQWTDLIIGVPRIQKDDTLIGSAQIVLFTGLVAGAAVEANHANNIAKSTVAAPDYQLFNNYILYSAAGTFVTNPNLLFNLGLRNYLTTAVAKDKYAWHKKNAINFAGAAAAVYLLHITDAFGWMDISFGLGSSSALSSEPFFLNTAYTQPNDFMMGPSLELKFSMPLR